MAHIIIPGAHRPERVVRRSQDGNQTLTVVEQLGTELSDDPRDFPALTAAHLMGGEAEAPTQTGVATQMDALMSRNLRARAVGAFLFKLLRDASPIMLYDVYLLGRPGFVDLLKRTIRPDSMAAGLSDAELELAWETFERNVQLLAAAGAKLRKRKDWRG